MDDKEQIEVLLEALQDQTELVTDTFVETNKIMMETINALEKSKNRLLITIVGIIFLFLTLITLF